jgi:hypothetical protein
MEHSDHEWADSQEEVYTFTLDVLDTRMPESDLRRAISESTQGALEDLKLDSSLIDADLEGGFAGLGEVAVLLVMKKVGTIVATGVLAGAGQRVGEFFFDQYIAPRLRARNLLPKGFRKIAGSKKKGNSE